MAALRKTKTRAPQIPIVWREKVPEVTYFDRLGYRIVARVEDGCFILTRYGWAEDPTQVESLVVNSNDTFRLKESLNVKNHDTLLKRLGTRFALKEPHNAFFKIKTSLDRRGIPYEVR